MKVSLNWAKQYLDFSLPPTTELVEKIGAQLGAVEEAAELGPKYEGVIIVKVVRCDKLEGSDHLNVCLVDDGGVTKDIARDEQGHIQVVCGAPNVTTGIFVAWLPPGSTVPSSYDTEPFVMESRELRGVVSNGMLASPKELAIGDSHEGLLLLDGTDLQPGASFSDTYQLDDLLIAIENKMFTHRPDCFGHLGIARELAAIQGHQFSSPEWYTHPLAPESTTSDSIQAVTVKNELPELCPRYMLAAIEGITIQPSPIWLQSQLARLGLRPINNVVDVTNYMMLLSGQPLHAFDFDKVALDGKAEITIRQPHSDEKLSLLDGKTITPRPEAIVIADQTKALGLAGVMGGNNSEIDNKTTRILLECATFDMYNIRRTSMEHGIFSEAVTRFSKGQSSGQCPAVLYKTIALITELCPGATLAHAIIDQHQPRQQNQAISVAVDFINQRLGLKLTAEDMVTLLKNAEFDITVTEEGLEVAAPFWRTDIEIREDIVEEIGRLYGFDKMPLTLPTRTIIAVSRNAALDLKTAIRAALSSAGANEVLSYSFVHGKLLDNVTQNRDQAFKLSNALSPDLQYFRLHALPSLLDKVHMNVKAGYQEFGLFELNKGHNLLHERDAAGGVPTEIEFLDFVYSARKSRPGAPFYRARHYLDALAEQLGLSLNYVAIAEDPHVPVADPYDYTRSAYVSVSGTDIFLGMVGEFKASVLKNLKLPSYSAGFTVGQQQLLDARAQISSAYHELPRFPAVAQDICFKVAAGLGYQELESFVSEQLTTAKPEHSRLTLNPLDIYQRDEATDHKQITFHISLAHFDKTMTDAEVSSLLDTLTTAVQDKFTAERI